MHPGDTIKIKKYEGGAPSGTKVKVTRIEGDEVWYTWKKFELVAHKDNVEKV